MRTVAVSVASAIAALAVVSGCTSSHHAVTPPVSPDLSTSSGPPLAAVTSDPPSRAATSAPPPTATTSTSTSPATPTSPATERVTIRPVTADGRPVAGYQVTTESFPGLMCRDGAFPASPVAVSPNIRWCGPSASYTVACWDSAVPSTVLCLRDPLKRALVRIRYQGTFTPIAAPRNPVPEEIVLDNGMACTIRAGGAWGRLKAHPDWVGYYGCDRWHADIFGPNSGDGIDQSAAPWTVHLVTDPSTGKESITTHWVTTAYFVGTAASPTNARTARDTPAVPPGLVGSWGGHGRDLRINPDGTVHLQFRSYVWCSATVTTNCDRFIGDVLHDGAQVDGKITAVQNANSVTVTISSTSVPADVPLGPTRLGKDIQHDAVALFSGRLSGTPYCGTNAPRGYCGA